MIKSNKILIFILFLESLISFSHATIVYIATDPSDHKAHGLNICKFNDANGIVQKCIHPEHFKDDKITSIGISPVTHRAYLTFSHSNSLYICNTYRVDGNIDERDCSVSTIRGGEFSWGNMAFTSDEEKLYLIDPKKNNIRVCMLNESGIPINGCPLINNVDESPRSKFGYPSGLAVVQNNSRILVTDAMQDAVLSCPLEAEGTILGACSIIKNGTYRDPRDLAVNRHLPFNVFVASGFSDNPIVVCNTNDYVSFSLCLGYPFEHVSDNINSITAITISADGRTVFVANGSTVFANHIGDGAHLIRLKGIRFHGHVNALTAYN